MNLVVSHDPRRIYSLTLHQREPEFSQEPLFQMHVVNLDQCHQVLITFTITFGAQTRKVFSPTHALATERNRT